MTRRAEVFQDADLHLPWVVQISDGPLTQRKLPIRDRSDWTHHDSTWHFATHSEALEYALAATGQSTGSTDEKEKS